MASGVFGGGAVLADIIGGAAIITMNRPEQGNSLNTPMFAALHEALDWSEAQGYRALLLRAEGKRFCVGGAIDTMQVSVAEALESGLPIAQDLIRRIGQITVPVVSAVQGPIGGGGIGLAFCADLVIVSDCMKARAGYVRIGLTPDVGASWAITRQIGPQRAMAFFCRNTDHSAQECLTLGLVMQIVPRAELWDRAMALTLELAQGPTGALAGTKRLIAQAMQTSLDAQLDNELREILLASRLNDATEGVRSFMEKRAPQFRGD